eukprot:TRINITY_DN917_c0_g3_i2.p1 TRINITY_DN917_c0_g3~~TRINITY_DN917_c0_g3_i2.p1  ORF type:complete len:262 (+),score=54.03 TRINITY_DN917_c0_g3_i2:394-1179(+)
MSVPTKISVSSSFQSLSLHQYHQEVYHVHDLAKLRKCKRVFSGYRSTRSEHQEPGGVITTCHQCHRHDTYIKAKCSLCPSYRPPYETRGQYCGPCLQTRYGENILEIMEVAHYWVCPLCRNLCNCNHCRSKKNLPSVSDDAKGDHASIAHYLIENFMTGNKDDDERDIEDRHRHRHEDKGDVDDDEDDDSEEDDIVEEDEDGLEDATWGLQWGDLLAIWPSPDQVDMKQAIAAVASFNNKDDDTINNNTDTEGDENVPAPF